MPSSFGIPSNNAIINENPNTGKAKKPQIERWMNSPQTITRKEMKEIPSRVKMMFVFVFGFIAVVF